MCPPIFGGGSPSAPPVQKPPSQAELDASELKATADATKTRLEEQSKQREESRKKQARRSGQSFGPGGIASIFSQLGTGDDQIVGIG